MQTGVPGNSAVGGLGLANRALREYAARALDIYDAAEGSRLRRFAAADAVNRIEVAQRLDVDVVLVWRLDRRGRSVTDLLATLQGGVPSALTFGAVGWRNWSTSALASSR